VDEVEKKDHQDFPTEENEMAVGGFRVSGWWQERVDSGGTPAGRAARIEVQSHNSAETS
jgi:hypothetical protein